MPLLIRTLASLLLVTLVPAAPVDGVEQHANALAMRAAGLTGLVYATTQTAGQYISQITVNGNVKNVLLDTGSISLWVKDNSGGSGPTFTANYASGSASGTQATGTVIVGNMTLPNQVFGKATSWTSDFDKYDGVLGLSPLVSQFNGQTRSWLNNIMPKLAEQKFGVNLPQDVPPKTGTISFGYYESSHAATDPIYHAVVDADKNTAWNLNIDSFGVPTGDVSLKCLFDTGTTNMMVPYSVAKAYWDQVNGAVPDNNADSYRWRFPCSSRVPDFVPRIGSHALVIPGPANVFKLDSVNKWCGSRLQASQTSSTNCVFGQPLFIGQYAVFDYKAKAIGLAPRM